MAAESRELLRRVSLFASLNDEALAGLIGHLRRRSFRHGTMIFHKDQAGDALYIVESGRVRLFVPAGGGEELTVDIAGPGEVFGELALLDGRPRSASAEAVEDTIAHTIDRETFKQVLATTPGLAAALIELLSARLRHVTDYAESLAFMDVHARVARALLELGDRYGVKANGIEIDWTSPRPNSRQWSARRGSGSTGRSLSSAPRASSNSAAARSSFAMRNGSASASTERRRNLPVQESPQGMYN